MRKGVKTAQSEERQKATMWLNVVIKRSDGRTTSVPVGIPIDQVKLPEGTEQWKKDQRALVQAIINKGAEMQGGERIELPTLSVELYKVPSENDVDVTDEWVPEL